MLLAVESYRLWENLGIDEGLKAIKEAGFEAVDFSFYWKAAPALLGEDYRENALKIKEALNKYDLKCNQAHAPFDFTYGMPEDDTCFEYLSIKRAIEACGIIGIDHIVVHGIKVFPEPPASERSLQLNYDYYKTFEPLCERYGVRIAIENLSGAFSFPDLLNQIVKRLDSKWFTGLVDVGHAWLHSKVSAGDFIRQLDKGILTGLHIQDNHGAELMKDEHLTPFLGTVDFDDLLKALKEVGYDGDFTMEVPRFLKFYADQGLLIPALKFSYEVGNKLRNDFKSLT
ncbi:MAG: sugar phosphate isomerase/epimerase [Lachnospiraceae bacterium]|nr:sugar phosphate isomerase/epimerase [Lachnospiraceae bacterium]